MGRPRKIQVPGMPPDTTEDTTTDNTEQPDDIGSTDAADVQVVLARQQATISSLTKRLAALEDKPVTTKGKRNEPVFSMSEAMAAAEADLAAGRRPRARLTEQGWYVHPESARIGSGRL